MLHDRYGSGRMLWSGIIIAMVFIVMISTSPGWAQESITPDNADHLVELAVLGYGYATDVTWSPDGKLLAVATSSGVLLYNTASFETAPQRIGSSTNFINSVAFSPDGIMLASGGRTGIQLWDQITGQEQAISLEETDGEVIGLAFSPDGTTLVSGSTGDTVSLWDAVTGERVAALAGHRSAVTEVAFSPDGAVLAAAGGYDDGMTGGDGLIRLWDMATKESYPSLGGHLTGVAFSPDGRVLASGGYDNAVHLWDRTTGELLATLAGHTGDVVRVAFSPDGTWLASSAGWEDSSIRLWDMAARESLNVLEGCVRQAHIGEMGGLAFSPDGRTLAVTCGSQGVMLWEVSTGQSQMLSQGYNAPLHSIAFSPDGTLLAVSGIYGDTIHLWDILTKTEYAVLHGHTDWIWSLDFSPDGTRLASGGQDRTVRLWDLTTGEAVLVLEGLDDAVGGMAHFSDEDGDVNQYVEMYSDIVRSVDFSPDGSRLAVGRADVFGVPGSFQLYDASTGEILADVRPQHSRVPSESAGVSGLTFSPDGTHLATTNGDCTLRLWEVGTLREQAVLGSESNNTCANSVAFSPDGALLAAGGAWSDCGWTGQICDPEKGEIYLWDVLTGDQLAALVQPMRGIEHVAFNPAGTILASTGYDGIVRLWDVSAEKLLWEMEGTAISSIAFSPDGTLLAFGGADGTLRLWGIAP